MRNSGNRNRSLVVVAVCIVIAFLAGRQVISAAYVNIGALALAKVQSTKACPLGLPLASLDTARIAQAQQYLERALAFTPGNQRALRLRGELALAQGDDASAYNDLMPVLQANPDDHATAQWVAYMEQRRGHTERALDLWRTAHAEAFLLALGECYESKEAWEQARQYYEFARDATDSLAAAIQLGNLAFSQKQYDQAEQAYTGVLRQTNDSGLIANAQFGLGQVGLREHNPTSAVQAFDAAFAATPNASMASRIGLVLRNNQQQALSAQWLMKWARLSPGSADPQRILGLNALDLRQPNQALDYFDQAIVREGPSAAIYYGIGNAYEQLDDVPQARQAYQHVLALDAQHVGARQRLQALDTKGTQKQ